MNLEILNVLAFGVTAKVEIPDRVGEPLSMTFIGDWGRRAGDCSIDALNRELPSADFCDGTENLNGDLSNMFPGFTFWGDSFIPSLNGDCGGLLAGLLMIEALWSCVTTLLTVMEFVKSSFFAVPKTLPGALIGLFIKALIGVFSVVASSSSDWSLGADTCVAFFGLSGDDFDSSTFGRPRVALPTVTPVFLTGLAFNPVSSSASFALHFAPPIIGTTFSLSGSSNFTDFLGIVALDKVAARPRADFFGGSFITTIDSSATSTFLGRPRSDRAGSEAAGGSIAAFFGRTGSATGGSTAIFFCRPRVSLAAVGACCFNSASGSGRDCVAAALLGRPRGLAASGSIIWPFNSSSSSSTISSARVLRLVVDMLRVAFALEAAVAIFVVLTPVSVVVAAARARVIRFGGDWSFIFAVILEFKSI